MQKKIIALAVAGLVSGVAFAQTNVTIYGVADANYIYANDSFNAGSKSFSAIQSGGQSGSRVGFKGTEDLGNGLAANFRFEQGINIDTGASGQGGRTFGRWSTVGLASKTLGEIQLGHRDTFQDELLGGMDANNRTTVAQVSPVYLDQDRIGNFAAYLSPIWGGLQLKAGVSTASSNPDSAVNEVEPTRITAAGQNTAAGTNNRVYTVAAQYNNGPLALGAAYDYNKLQGRSNTLVSPALGSDSSFDAGNVWNIAGAFDFKVVRVHAAYGMINYAENNFGVAAGNETRDQRKQWSLGLSAPVGANGLATLVYARAKVENNLPVGASDDKSSMWGAAYFHNLSKRTNLYAAYGDINQDDSAIKATISGTTGGYQRAIQVGLRHKF